MITGNEPVQKQQVTTITPFGNTDGFYGGLTIRQKFAAMAMQGLLANFQANGMYGSSVGYPMVEEAAVRCADQLIAELNKTSTT